MIDFEKAQSAFKEYLKQYDLADGSVNLKVVHTYGVVEKSEYIARELGLDEDNVLLAKLIAILHDIGRFEQVKLTKDFIEDFKYDEVIGKAIYNHNKYAVEDGLR